MKTRKQSSYIYIYILIAILNLSFIGPISFINTPSASALSYSSDIGVSFTFLPTLGITLSSGGCGSGISGLGANLCINNLSPGAAADSNILNVTVLNNTGNGYTLNASVGSDTIGGGKYNTRDLIHQDSATTGSFISLDPGASIVSNTLFNDNEWGFSYMDETLSSPTWSNYSGLPLYSDTTPTTLKSSLSPSTTAEGDNIKFKIAAKSSTTQASGEYNNVINFTVTAQPIPVTLYMAYENAGKEKYNGYFKMQDMSSDICNAADVLDEASQMQVIDVRDNKVYWITKLQDGHCWMTQNLDLNLDSSIALTSETTDLTYYGDKGYDSVNGYSQQTVNGKNVISWTPVRSTIDAVTDENTAGSIQGWMNDSDTPYSMDTGDYYWRNEPFYNSHLCGNDNCSYLAKSADWLTYFSATPYVINGTHGHTGNKYNWSAAVASNNTSSYTLSTYNNIANNPQNSICPAGWRLPTVAGSSPTYTEKGSKNEFARLAYLYDNYIDDTSISSEGLEKSPLYFTRSGYEYNGTLRSAGYDEAYWSSSVYNNASVYRIGFKSDLVIPEHYSALGRHDGFSIRCLAR